MGFFIQNRYKVGEAFRSTGGRRNPKPAMTASVAFTSLLTDTGNENLSDLYKRDLAALVNHFLEYLKRSQLGGLPIADIGPESAKEFLNQFKSSATNYMNRRRPLSSLFSRLVSMGRLAVNPVKGTGKMKQSAYLNVPYKKEQLHTVLDEVRKSREQLYLCCLLMYGCLLRPHQEIRLLKRGAFNDDLTMISLSGKQNKSRRIRSVHVPRYVRDVLIEQKVDHLDDGMNIFSSSVSGYNMSYFNTTWTRIKEKLMNQGVISQHHTLYSFRHTAAVNMYLKTKDPYKIQQAFGHSSLRVTLQYLRNLGLVVDSSIDDLPDL